jgi:tetratricopeptide (TPR) repeat protein
VFLGIAAIHQGESALAVKYLEERLSIVRGLESPADYANTIYSLGLAKSEEGRFSEAIVQIEEALSAFRERGEQFWIANAVGGLAFIALMQGREGDARALLEEYLEMAVQLQDKANIAAGLEGLAALATETGDLRPACRLFACAGSLRAEIGGRLMSQRNSKFVEQRLNSARARLGDDEWARAWEEGKAMSPEQAIDLGPPTSPSDL